MTIPQIDHPALDRWKRLAAEPPLQSEHVMDLIESAQVDEEVKVLARKLATDGYAILDLSGPEFDAAADRIARDLAPHVDNADRRCAEAWTFQQDVRDIACDERVVDLLRVLYQREPIPFQTLNFEVGTQQPAHSDTVHFHCRPHGFMCGVWVALEDIHPDAGPLLVYPKSQNLPLLTMPDLGLPPLTEHYEGYEIAIHKLLHESGFEALPVVPKKGEAIVWVANLFHGAIKVNDPTLTRRSQVTHYYFEDCMYYQPLESDLEGGGRVTMREVIDLRTGKAVPHKVRGRTIDVTGYPWMWEYPRPLPKWVDMSPPSGDDVVKPDDPSHPFRHVMGPAASVKRAVGKFVKR